jgi:hypothetical protein
MIRRLFSTSLNSNNLNAKNSKLNPWFISGFTDAEASFIIKIAQTTSRLGWSVKPAYVIHLHKRDLELLKKIQF